MGSGKAVAVAVVVVMVVGQVHTKRGCINFGHSCFGGQGKRASAPAGRPEEPPAAPVVDDEDPAFVFTGPRSWPAAAGPAMGAPRRPTPDQLDAAVRSLRQWILNNYNRHEQEMNDI